MRGQTRRQARSSSVLRVPRRLAACWLQGCSLAVEWKEARSVERPRSNNPWTIDQFLSTQGKLRARPGQLCVSVPAEAKQIPERFPYVSR